MAARPGREAARSHGRAKPADFDLLKHNLGMAGALEAFLAPAYGPGGRAKLFLDSKGRPIPTTDGAQMLEGLDSPHPVGRILTALAAAQDEQWQDGTKLATLLTLRLLRRAEPLLDRGIRPARIVRGYEIGANLASEAASTIAVTADPFANGLLPEVARAALGGWLESAPRERLATEIVQMATQVASRYGNGWRCDRRDMHVFAKATGGFAVQRIDGYLLERSRDDPTMPRQVENARIALFDAAPIRGKAGIHEPRLRWIGDTKIRLKSPAELDAYAAVGEKHTEAIVDGLGRAGANVVLCTLGISDYGHKLLAKAGILGIRRIMKTHHLEAIARATGAKLIKDFRNVQADQLGRAGVVEERRIGGSKCLIIDRCPNPKVVSLLISGPGTAAAEQYQAQARKAIGAVSAAIEEPQFVPGGAGTEMIASLRVRAAASRVAGREQLAVEAFAAALEDIAGCLATNLGMKPLDSVLALRVACSRAPSSGFLAGEPGPVDIGHGLFREPLAPRLSAWRRAVEAATTILRADAFLKVSRAPKPETPGEDKAKASEGTEKAA